MTFDMFLAKCGRILTAVLPFVTNPKTAAEVKIATAVINEVRKPDAD